MNRKNKIKAIVLDLVGVLVREKDSSLSKVEQFLESQLDTDSDEVFYAEANRKTGLSRKELEVVVDRMFEKIYELRDPSIFSALPKVKLMLACNHIGAIKKWLDKMGFSKNFYAIVISAEIGAKKPQRKFYQIMTEMIKETPRIFYSWTIF